MKSIADLNATELRATATLDHPDAAPVEVGGQPVDPAVIEDLRTRVRACADELGFPESLNRAAVTRFDRPATRILHDTMDIIPADAAAMGVWSYLSLVALPDISVWRWPDRAADRILGKPRNVFRRLWWRAEIVGSDLIDAPRGLGEDELVNIMERATIAANRRLARSMAAAIVGLPDTGLARSELMRDMARRILRLQSVLCFDALEDNMIDSLVGQTLDASITALGAEKDMRPQNEQRGPDEAQRQRWWQLRR
jgi:hypothetical protein